ncbi:MAG: HD domain-containing protein [Prevotellaceae bacterium]|jgi:HD superfamily phosphohydrolase|nr:HD domain-containing protein [Prevotellaceae bacterium]
MNFQNKRKIINDPVFGFISIPSDFQFDIIQHPYFQRLSRIKQLGLASFVYPGAQHKRLQHSLGAMFLMNMAVEQLIARGQEITEEEKDAVLATILLHDVGHGPFSHVLENTLMDGVWHEEISLMLLEKMNAEMGGKLDMAIAIFKDKYPKRFLHQLVSGQLDMDRLDYLTRDSFFTGVVEGNIGFARLIKMLNVTNDQLVVEAKGIYSAEQFLVARRFMFWQVYLHKTSVVGEQMLIAIIRRAKELLAQGKKIFALPQFLYFLENKVNLDFFRKNPEAIEQFVQLDDNDIISTIKIWASADDVVLSRLSRDFINRRLFKIHLLDKAVNETEIREKQQEIARKLGISLHEASYFVATDMISNNTYTPKDDRINILYNDGTTKDISAASDMFNISVLNKEVRKYFYCYLRE